MGSITELPSGTDPPPGDPRPRAVGIPNAFVFAAGVVVGAALMIAVREQPTPEPSQAPRSAAPSSAPATTGPSPSPTSAPSEAPVPLSDPVHLSAGSPVSVEIDGLLVTLAVPSSFESDYFAPHLLATARSDTPGLVITTTDQVGAGCLQLAAGSPEAAATPVEGPPATTAARGPVTFTLDGYPGHYFHFMTPSGSCHPNQVWDDIVGDLGGRGVDVQLELWALDVSGRTLVFGAYTGNNAPAARRDELREVIASAQVEPIHAEPAGLTPEIIETGFIGLPPAGAEPGAPDPAFLIDEYPVDGGGLPIRGLVRVYDDGRMIWYRFYDGPAGENALSTGYLEQHLTPVGVAMVRAHTDLAEKDPIALAEWLPPGAWEDREVRAYVPTRYAACFAISSLRFPPGEPFLDSLPTAARDLLRDKPLVGGGPAEWECRGLTTDEARTLDAELRSAGVQQSEELNQYVLGYDLGESAVIFEPIFPDGAIGCSACG